MDFFQINNHIYRYVYFKQLSNSDVLFTDTIYYLVFLGF